MSGSATDVPRWRARWQSWRPHDRRECLVAYLLLALWCLPLYISFETRGPLSSDWEYFLSYFEAFRKTVLEYREFPGLNPWNSLGSPLWANPQIGPLSHFGLLVLLFGTLPGLKLGMVLGTFLAFETARALGRRLFETPTAPVIVGLLYALNGALAAQLTRGQLCFGSYFLAPLLVLAVLQLGERRWAGLLAGLVSGVMVHYGVHYFVLHVLTLSAILAIAHTLRQGAWRPALRFAALFALTFVAVAAVRLVPMLTLLMAHPRDVQVPLSLGGSLLLRALFSPSLGPASHWMEAGPGRFPIGSWELVAYAGVGVWLFALLSLRWGLRFYHVGAALAFWLMLGNSSSLHLSRWIDRLPPFDSAWLVFRWRVVLLCCLAYAAARGVDRWLVAPRPAAAPHFRRWVVWLLPLELLLLLGPSWFRYVTPAKHREITRQELKLPATSEMLAVRVHFTPSGDRSIFALVRANVGTKLGYEPLFGYGIPTNARVYRGHPAYHGELSVQGRRVAPAHWSPNRIVARGLPVGQRLEVNLNPGRGFWVNGRPYFRKLRLFALERRFIVEVPSSGVVKIEYRTPGLSSGLWASLSAGLLLLGWFLFERRRSV